MKRTRRVNEDTNLAFLDIICCGFGAIVLLLVIIKPSPPVVYEESENIRDGKVRQLQERLFEIRGQVDYLEKELNAKQAQLGEDKRRVAILLSEFDRLNSRKSSQDDTPSTADEAADLRIALQTLTAEMKRLLSQSKLQNDYIGGIPVDSEYIIFIIDTSGSMFNFAWNRMLQEVVNTLNIYPKVRGIQVLNDQGQYLFSTYRGDWIPDTPARRKAIIQRLRNWNAFSNSSPVEGISKAISQFYDPKKKISLYVFGDDYSGRSVRRVLDLVKRLNSKRAGKPLVRIHAVGFPVQFLGSVSTNSSVVRYASLMRELAQQNNGAFIGLSNIR